VSGRGRIRSPRGPVVHDDPHPAHILDRSHQHVGYLGGLRRPAGAWQAAVQVGLASMVGFLALNVMMEAAGWVGAPGSRTNDHVDGDVQRNRGSRAGRRGPVGRNAFAFGRAAAAKRPGDRRPG
jgi:hypothetical protein